MSAADVQGTGRGGRVTKGDVLAAAERRPAPAPAAPPAAPRPAPVAPAVALPAGLGQRPEQRVPMSRLRQRVAERLVAVAVDRGDPDHVQRSQHAAGDRPAQPVQGPVREGARRQARLHGVLRQGRGARAEEVPGRQRVDRRHATSSTTATSTSASRWAARADSSCRSCATPISSRSPRSRRGSPISASARRKASSPSRS